MSEPAEEEALAAMTRAQAKQKREEEERSSKKEKDSGITCSGISPGPVTKDPIKEGMWSPRPEDDLIEKNADTEQEVTDAPGGDAEGTTTLDGDSFGGVDGKELRKLQLEDETLKAVQESTK